MGQSSLQDPSIKVIALIALIGLEKYRSFVQFR